MVLLFIIGGLGRVCPSVYILPFVNKGFKVCLEAFQINFIR